MKETILKQIEEYTSTRKHLSNIDKYEAFNVEEYIKDKTSSPVRLAISHIDEKLKESRKQLEYYTYVESIEVFNQIVSENNLHVGLFINVGDVDFKITEHKVNSNGEPCIVYNRGAMMNNEHMKNINGFEKQPVEEVVLESYQVNESDFTDFQKQLSNTYSLKELQKLLNKQLSIKDKYISAYAKESLKNKAKSNVSTARYAHSINNRDSNLQWIKDYSNAIEYKINFKIN
ncbi:TPA: hypothetical protein ACG0AB_000757 [Elizabethkingia anophelis]